MSMLYGFDTTKIETWTSAEGQTMLAAVLDVDITNSSVKFRREDGRYFTTSFDLLASEDVDRLIALATPEVTKELPKNDGGKKLEDELPKRFELDKVPMVRQKGAYCVPASAAMIAGFHEIDTDQDQIAHLTSSASFNNQGTNPHDMLLAMEKLGLEGKPYYWKNNEDFTRQILPIIRDALYRKGPVYISFRPGVFGDTGHGCIIIGYHDRKEELTFHNPWGHVFEKEYDVVGTQARGIAVFEAPKLFPAASDAYIQNIQRIIPKFESNLIKITQALEKAEQKNKIIWCSRKDARHDRRFAVDTARDDGRTILKLAFRRNPAVIIPGNRRDGTTEKLLFVTRSRGGGAAYMVREITPDGWTEPGLFNVGRLTRVWPTRLQSEESDNVYWELPMIELHPNN